MAFLRKLADHLFNQVLVESLSNARWFQRFAVKSTQMMNDLGAQGKGGAQAQLGETVTKFYESAKQQGSKYRSEFEAEMKKLNEQPGAGGSRGGQQDRKP